MIKCFVRKFWPKFQVWEPELELMGKWKSVRKKPLSLLRKLACAFFFCSFFWLKEIIWWLLVFFWFGSSVLFCVTKNSLYLNQVLRESVLDLLLHVDLQLQLIRAFWQCLCDFWPGRTLLLEIWPLFQVIPKISQDSFYKHFLRNWGFFSVWVVRTSICNELRCQIDCCDLWQMLIFCLILCHSEVYQCPVSKTICQYCLCQNFVLLMMIIFLLKSSLKLLISCTFILI